VTALSTLPSPHVKANTFRPHQLPNLSKSTATSGRHARSPPSPDQGVRSKRPTQPNPRSALTESVQISAVIGSWPEHNLRIATTGPSQSCMTDLEVPTDPSFEEFLFGEGKAVEQQVPASNQLAGGLNRYLLIPRRLTFERGSAVGSPRLADPRPGGGWP